MAEIGKKPNPIFQKLLPLLVPLSGVIGYLVGQETNESKVLAANIKIADQRKHIASIRPPRVEGRIAALSALIARRVPDTRHPHVWAEVTDAFNPNTRNEKENTRQVIGDIQLLDEAAREVNLHPASLLFALRKVNFDEAARMEKEAFVKSYLALLHLEKKNAPQALANTEAKKIFLLAKHPYFGMHMQEYGETLKENGARIFAREVDGYHEVGSTYNRATARKR